MAEWHFSYDGQQTGPFNDSEAQAKARSNQMGTFGETATANGSRFRKSPN